MPDQILSAPPHSLEAERATLGSLLIDKEAILKVADILDPTDFYLEKNSILYEEILNLYNQRAPIDLVTLAQNLEDKKKMDLAGGNAYMVELTNEVPTATHVLQYATIVKHKSTLRKLILAGEKVKSLGYEEEKEIKELLEDAEKNIFSVSQTFLKDRFIHIKDILAQTYEKISDLHDPESKDKYRGIASGFKSLDNIISGFQPSDFVVLAARPSMGKTSLALNVAVNIAKNKQSVGIISLEMSKEQLVERMFCSLLSVDSWKMRTGKLEDQDFARIGGIMDELNSLKMYIDDSLGNSIIDLRTKARRLQMEHGLDFLIIDYLQLMEAGTKSFGQSNRVQEISEISRSLKSLARELHVPIMALSQLSRAVEMRPSKIPQLSDLRESGAIEQDADLVMMMYREDYYEEDTDRAGITDLHIRKHRNGPTGKVELKFAKEQMKFYDIEKKRGMDGMPTPPPPNQVPTPTMPSMPAF